MKEKYVNNIIDLWEFRNNIPVKESTVPRP